VAFDVHRSIIEYDENIIIIVGIGRYKYDELHRTVVEGRLSHIKIRKVHKRRSISIPPLHFRNLNFWSHQTFSALCAEMCTKSNLSCTKTESPIPKTKWGAIETVAPHIEYLNFLMCQKFVHRFCRNVHQVPTFVHKNSQLYPKNKVGGPLKRDTPFLENWNF